MRNNLAELFRKSMTALEKGGITAVPGEKIVCPSCKRMSVKKALQKDGMVCRCGYHFRLTARERISLIFDKENNHELFAGIRSSDPLAFPGYAGKLAAAGASSGEREAVVCGVGMIRGKKCAYFVMDTNFMMASMGSAVGEKITRLFEFAAKNKLPVIGFTASGGARMQEGVLSLMQMAKVSGAVKKHSDKGLLYITVLTDPTTGGVTASFAMQGDIILSEPGALVGFAGKRIIEQTTGTTLPDSFQKAEFVLEHGFIDAVIPRTKLRIKLAQLLYFHENEVQE